MKFSHFAQQKVAVPRAGLLLVTAVIGQNCKEQNGNVEDELENIGEEQRLEGSAVGQTLVTAAAGYVRLRTIKMLHLAL
jgi:hypothetical protein